MTLKKWDVFHSVLISITFPLALIFDQFSAFVCLGIGSILTLVFTSHQFKSSKESVFTTANFVSLTRLIMLAIATTVFTSSYLFAGATVVFLLMDGLDGYIARKTNTESKLGAYLDMESDSFSILLLGIFLYQNLDFGAWVFFAGALRYLFVITRELVSPDWKAESRRKSGRLFFVILIAGFVSSLLYTGPWNFAPLALGTILVTFSFSIDFRSIFADSSFFRKRYKGKPGENDTKVSTP